MRPSASRRAVGERFATGFVGPHPDDIRRFVRVGVPIGGQWTIDMASFVIFTTLVARMGDVQMAASQAFVMLLSLSFMQAIGISVAASTLVGRYIGAEDRPAAIQSFRSSQKFAGILGGAIAVLLDRPQWLPASGYESAHDYLIELYDQRFKGLENLAESELDVYVPVR